MDVTVVNHNIYQQKIVVINMKCFNEKEIKAIKSAIKCELSKNKKVSSATLDSTLEKIESFKCPEETLLISKISELPLSERIKYARMMR